MYDQPPFSTPVSPGLKDVDSDINAGRLVGDLIAANKKVILVNDSDLADRLTALFNPNKLSLGLKASIGKLNPVGSSGPVQNYHHTESISTSIELYWSKLAMAKYGYKRGASVSIGHDSGDNGSLDSIAGWLSQFIMPRESGVAPPALRVIWPNTLTMLFAVYGLQWEYTHWDADLTPRIMRATLTVEELIKTPRYGINASGGFSKGAGQASGVSVTFGPTSYGRGPKMGGT